MEKRKLSADAIEQIEDINKQVRIKQIELNRVLSQEAERLDCPADADWVFSPQTMEFVKRGQSPEMAEKKK